MPQTLLIVQDEEPLRESLERIFRKDGLTVDAAGLTEEYMRAFVRKYETDHTGNGIAGMPGITSKTLWERRRKWGMKRPASQGTAGGEG